MHGNELKKLVELAQSYMWEAEAGAHSKNYGETEDVRDEGEYIEYYFFSKIQNISNKIKRSKISNYMLKKYKNEIEEIFDYADYI